MYFANAILRFVRHVPSQKIHPCKKGPWIKEISQHKQQSNINSNQDANALQDELESLLMLDPDELYWLKESYDERKIKSGSHCSP